MRFVLFSDLHLDAPFVWAPREVARRRRRALRTTLERILALADEVGADAVLCAGDLYEHGRITPDTANWLVEAFGSAGRPVIVAPGNHDPLLPGSVYRRDRLPVDVHVFTEERLTPLRLDDGLTLWGAGHRTPANTPGYLDTGFRVDRGGVSIALFHGSERGGFAGEGSEKRPHAPFDAVQVPTAGLSHAFVGHHHRPCDGAHHTYPGNPDPLTFGEDGERGAVIVDVRADGTVARERRAVATSRVVDVPLDVTGCRSSSAIVEAARAVLADHTGAVVRLTVTGELHPDVELDLDALDTVPSGCDTVLVRRGAVRIGHDLDALAAEATIRGQLVRDVLASEDPDRDLVLTVALRALDGRDDLEVV